MMANGKPPIPSTCEEMREVVKGFLLQGGNEARKFWDIITCQRGPDSPSERPDQDDATNRAAYEGRRKRKYGTVEVIRAASFGGVVGGSARSHKGTKVTLPPPNEWDHFDRHVQRAAEALGLEVEILKEEKGIGAAVAAPPMVKAGDTIKVKPGVIEFTVPQIMKKIEFYLNKASTVSKGKAPGYVHQVNYYLHVVNNYVQKLPEDKKVETCKVIDSYCKQFLNGTTLNPKEAAAYLYDEETQAVNLKAVEGLYSVSVKGATVGPNA